MKKTEYEKMYELEDSHFWFVGKRFFIAAYLKKILQKNLKILDIGSGTGGITKFLEKYGRVTGVEKNTYAIYFAKKRGLQIIRGEVEKLPFSDKTRFDLVTIFDVLYHKNVKKLNLAISEVKKVLKPNGYLLITDSAFNLLKGDGHSSSVDEVRRFTLKEMENILEKSSFKIISSSYTYFFLFPFILFKRKVLDKLTPSNNSDVFSLAFLINQCLLFILKLESLVLERTRFPFGTSLIILAQKYEK